MKSVVRALLQNIIDDIDADNSNINEEDALKIARALKRYTRKDIPMSKYQAYTYLNISRATFDKLVKEGKLPEGKKTAGFKELSWTKRDLDKYLKSIKNES